MRGPNYSHYHKEGKGAHYSPANGDKDPGLRASNSTMTDFHELQWHDARLMSIHIDRSEPGQRDEVQLAVEWPDSSAATILFRDVYALRCELNFGVIAYEAIMSANQVSESVEITRLREREHRV